MEREVIIIARNLLLQASRAAAWIFFPALLNWFAQSTIKIEFFVEIPIKITSAICENIFILELNSKIKIRCENNHLFIEEHIVIIKTNFIYHLSTSSTHHSPLRYGDTVNCRLWVSKVGRSSTDWNYSFTDQILDDYLLVDFKSSYKLFKGYNLDFSVKYSTKVLPIKPLQPVINIFI